MKKIIIFFLLLLFIQVVSADTFVNITAFNADDWDNTGTYGAIHSSNKGSITGFLPSKAYYTGPPPVAPAAFNRINISNGTADHHFNGTTFCVEFEIKRGIGGSDCGVGFGDKHPTDGYNGTEFGFTIQGDNFNVYGVARNGSLGQYYFSADSNHQYGLDQFIGVRFCREPDYTFNVTFWNITTPYIIHKPASVVKDLAFPHYIPLNFTWVHAYEVPFNVTRIWIFNESVIEGGPDTTPPVISDKWCTSCYPPDNTEPYNTYDSTPTINFTTDEDADTYISNDNVTWIPSTTGWGTVHIATINDTQALGEGEQIVYIKAVDGASNNGYDHMNFIINKDVQDALFIVRNKENQLNVSTIDQDGNASFNSVNSRREFKADGEPGMTNSSLFACMDSTCTQKCRLYIRYGLILKCV